MNIEKFGTYIQSRRKDLGMTQQELADLVGVTNKAVSKWERGQSIPDIALFKSIAKHLDVEIIDLLSAGDLQDSEQIEKKEVSSIMEKALEAVQNFNLKKIIQVSYYIAMVGCVIGLITTILVDFVLSGTMTWSLVSTASILGAMVVLTVIRFTYTNLVYCFFGVMMSGLVISIPILYAVGYYLTDLSWFGDYFIYYVVSSIGAVIISFIYFNVSKQHAYIKIHVSVIILDLVSTLVQLFVMKEVLLMIPNLAGLVVLLVTLPITINYVKNKE